MVMFNDQYDLQDNLIIEVRNRLTLELKQRDESLNKYFLDDKNIYRCIKAKHENIEKAIKMIIETNQWRNKYDINNFGTVNIYEKIKIAKKYFNFFWLGYDNVGHPIYVECQGTINFKNLFEELTIDDLVDIYISHQEFALKNIYTPSPNKCDSVITKMFAIIDMKGVGLTTFGKKMYSYIKRIIQIGNDHYPETSYKIYLINTPLLFSFIWKIIKVWLEEDTKQKITIFRDNGYNELIKHINPDILQQDFDLNDMANTNSELEDKYLKWCSKFSE